MPLLFIVQILAVLVLLSLFALRARTAFRNPQARPAWYASGLALVGLMTIDVLLPLRGVDAVLGGGNWIYLVRSISAVAALWFLRDAIGIQARRSPRRSEPWILLVLTFGIAVAFLLTPERGDTSTGYVDAHALSPFGFIWVFLYMGTVAWVCIESALLVASLWRTLYFTFLLGAVLVALGSISEIAHVTFILSGLEPRSFDPFYVGFQGLFYPGVLLITVGFMISATQEHWGRALWRYRLWKLHRVRNRYPSHFPLAESTRSFSADDPTTAAYDEWIAIKDLEAIENIELNDVDKRFISTLASRFAGIAIMPGFQGGPSK